MYIIVLGGDNDLNGNLSLQMLARLKKFNEVYDKYKKNEPKIIISGGFRFSKISHSNIVKKFMLEKYPNINIVKEFEENNNTVDEAINIGNYLRNNVERILIITSNWHLPRAKYLFGKVFEKNNSIEYMETNENEPKLKQEEETKLYNLKTKPYGKWKEYISIM